MQSVLHKPDAPETAPTELTPTMQAPAPAPVTNPNYARAMSAAWDQLAVGPVDDRVNPEDIRLPANIVRELDRAWEDSLATTPQREQGGNLVRNSVVDMRSGVNRTSPIGSSIRTTTTSVAVAER